MTSPMHLMNYFKELPSTTIVAFVKHQKEMSERMKNIYMQIKEVTSAEIRRMSEEEVLNINNTMLNKIDHIFVLDEFTGQSYEHLVSKRPAKFTIFGVLYLENLTDVTITNHWKIFNNSFQDLVICTSNLHSTERSKIEDLVKSMNGRFTNQFSSEVTHLITNSTKTVKYYEATSLDIPIYHTEWVYNVWKKCFKQNNVLKANSEQFDAFKLPPLFDLKITATSMSKEKRSEISDIIEENGGKFDETFKSNETDILVMDKKDPENSKFKLANKYKIPVLNINWIHESVLAGHALPYDDFAFKRIKSHDSSSSSNSLLSDSTTNISVEEVQPKKDAKETIEEPPKTNSTVLTDKSNEQFISTYTVEQAKKLGHILDGYIFYFYNFPTEHYFKVGKLISACGGIRITELDQSVTHILCFDKANLEDLQKKTVEKEFHGSMVDCKWLVECFKQEKLLSETDYIITVPSLSRKIVPPSPLSRKAIQSLNVSITKFDDESKKENGIINKESSSKMLIFSSHSGDELIQNSKQQVAKVTISKKRSYEGDLDLIDKINKRRKMNDDDEYNKNSFQVL